MFVLATVGTIMLGSYKVGLIIFASHAVGALLVSIIASTIKLNYKSINNATSKSKMTKHHTDIFDIIEKAIINTARIMAKYLGCCCFFRLISDIAFSSSLFGVDINYIKVLIRGSLELVDGCINAAHLPILPACCLISFIISFGDYQRYSRAYPCQRYTIQQEIVYCRQTAAWIIFSSYNICFPKDNTSIYKCQLI